MAIPAVVPPPSPPSPVEPVFGEPTVDGQVSIRGLLLDIQPLAPIIISSFQPFGIQAVRSSDENKDGQHGVWTSPDYLPALQIPLNLVVNARTQTEVVSITQALTAAFGPAESPIELKFRLAGKTYSRFGMPRLLDPDLSRIEQGVSKVSAGFTSTDPFYYGDPQAWTTTLPLPGEGIAPPLTPPLTLPERPGGGFIVADVEGTQPTKPILRFTGPGRNPGLLNRTTNKQLAYDLELSESDFLTVDCRAGVALLNGTAFRAPALGSAITARFELVPGINSLQILGQSSSTTGTLGVSVTAAPAYV